MLCDQVLKAKRGEVHFARAFKQSAASEDDIASQEAVKLATLWGVPGVMQGESVVPPTVVMHESLEIVYLVSE